MRKVTHDMDKHRDVKGEEDSKQQFKDFISDNRSKAQTIRSAWENRQHRWDFKQYPIQRIAVYEPPSFSMKLPASTPTYTEMPVVEFEYQRGYYGYRKYHRVVGRYKGVEIEVLLEPIFEPSKEIWRCPIGNKGCTKNCGNYGCGN